MFLYSHWIKDRLEQASSTVNFLHDEMARNVICHEKKLVIYFCLDIAIHKSKKLQFWPLNKKICMTSLLISINKFNFLSHISPMS